MTETNVETETEQPNSVEISINAKGLYSGKCKNYATNMKEAWETALKYSDELEKLVKSKNG